MTEDGTQLQKLVRFYMSSQGRLVKSWNNPMASMGLFQMDEVLTAVVSSIQSTLTASEKHFRIIS